MYCFNGTAPPNPQLVSMIWRSISTSIGFALRARRLPTGHQSSRCTPWILEFQGVFFSLENIIGKSLEHHWKITGFHWKIHSSSIHGMCWWEPGDPTDPCWATAPFQDLSLDDPSSWGMPLGMPLGMPKKPEKMDGSGEKQTDSDGSWRVDLDAEKIIETPQTRPWRLDDTADCCLWKQKGIKHTV